MKKLMVMLGAVAMSFGLFAALPNTWTADDKTAENWNDGQWVGEGTNKVTFGTGLITIATGSDVLQRQVDAGKDYYLKDGFFAEAVIDFKDQALEDVPAVDTNAKIGIFALDGTEIEGAPAGTNLYVMGGYGDGGAALFKIIGYNETLVTDGARKIVVKGYDKADGTRSGFAVYVSKGGVGETIMPVKVDVVYPIVDNVVQWNAAGTLNDYLGLKDTGLTIQAGNRWYEEKSLFLSIDSIGTTAAKVTTLDFKGNADIAEVNFTETYADFPPDGFQMTVAGNTKIANITGATTNEDCSAITSFTLGQVKIWPATELPIVEVTADGTAVTGNKVDGYEFTMADGKVLEINAYSTAATVKIGEGDAEPCKDIATAVSKANGATAAATITLAQNVTDAENMSFENANGIVLDLAGKTITFAEGEGIANAAVGVLTITDSLTGGKIVGRVANQGVMNIEKGIFDGQVYAVSGTLNITGGAFDKENNSTGDGQAFKFDVGPDYEAVDGTGDLEGYWVIQPATPKIEYVTFTVSYDASKVENVTVKTNGEDVVGVTGNYIVESNAVVTITADAADGFKDVQITSTDVTVVGGVFTASKADQTITITADAMVYAKIPEITESFTYNAQAKTAITDGTDYTVAGGAVQTNAGDYEAEVALATGYDAWEDGSTTNKFIAWSIARAVATVRAVDQTIKVGESPAAYTATVSPAAFGADVIAYTVTCPTYVDAEGEYTIVVALGDNPNYDLTPYNGTLKVEAAGPVIPEPEDLPEAEKAAYNNWYTSNPAESGDVALSKPEDLKDAYLLGCKAGEEALEAARKEFKFASIAFVNGEWVATIKNSTGESHEFYGNGAITVKSYSDVECKTEAANGNFFKATLGYKTK